MTTTDEIIRKYSQKIESQINQSPDTVEYSKEYQEFKQEMLPQISKYKRWTDSLGSVIKIRLSEKERAKIQRNLNIAHLNVDASQAASLALMAMLSTIFIVLLGVLAFVFLGDTFPIMFTLLGFV